MGLDRLRLVTQFLVGAGRSSGTPAACIEDGTTAAQARLRASVTTVTGDVMQLRETLRWFDA